MVRHQHEGVQTVSAVVPVMHERFYKYLTRRSGFENCAALPSARRYKVRTRRVQMSLRNRHALSGSSRSLSSLFRHG